MHYLCLHVCNYIMHTYKYVCVRMFEYINILMYIYIYIYAFTYVITLCMHACKYVCVCLLDRVLPSICLQQLGNIRLATSNRWLISHSHSLTHSLITQPLTTFFVGVGSFSKCLRKDVSGNDL